MDNIEVLITEEDVRARIQEMADFLSERYAGKELTFVGILNGSVFFMTALAQAMTIPVTLDFMVASSYGAGTVSSGNVVIEKDLANSIVGKHVLVVEDIVDSGHTLSLVCEMLRERSPKSLEVCTLLDKPERRENDFKADFVGFEIPDAYVVGWGMDADQKYRDLSFIGVVKE